MIDYDGIEFTHYKLVHQGNASLDRGVGEAPKLENRDENYSGSIQDREKVYLQEIIERLNQLFEGELTEDDRLNNVRHFIKYKVLESDTFKKKAENNDEAQFRNSPDLQDEIMEADIKAQRASEDMSHQAIGSEAVRNGIRDILLEFDNLSEELRNKNRENKP